MRGACVRRKKNGIFAVAVRAQGLSSSAVQVGCLLTFKKNDSLHP